MNILVVLQRSAKFCAESAAKLATNVPEELVVEIPIAAIPEDTRKRLTPLFNYNGVWPTQLAFLRFDDQFRLSRYSEWGKIYFTLDAHNPTPREVGLSITAAFHELDKKREEYEQKIRDKESLQRRCVEITEEIERLRKILVDLQTQS